jgi:CubicO group peptidase (beta-lactamase class C family)
MIRLSTFLVSVITVFQLAAGTPDNKELIAQFDKLLSTAFAPDKPGATVLVARKGEILYQKAIGLANVELGTPMKTDNVFEIGSITKQFTAVAVLMLLEEGKLSLDDDITRFLPDYPTHGHHISIHHLLTHTSGIKSYTELEKWTKEWRRDFTPQEMIDFFKDEPMTFAPGEKYAYNNSAYFILGYVIEKASGMTYEDFIEQRIFTPLGMTNSRYGHKDEITPNRAAGYSSGVGVVNAPYLSMTQPYAAGSIMSTVGDLYRWNTAVHQYKLVSKSTLEKAFTDYTLNNGDKIGYGYGWGISDIQGSLSWEHSGGIFGYVSNGIYLPKEDLYIAILCNHDEQNVGELSTRMAALALGKPFPADMPAISLKTEELDRYCGTYKFEDDSERTISREGSFLYSLRTGSPTRFKIIPYAPGKFYYENSLSAIEFARDGDEMTAVFDNRGTRTRGRISDSPSAPGRMEITLTPDQLQPFVGTFEIQPGFNIVFTVEDGQLMTQATGQQKFPVYPETPTRFFLKVVDAQVEFMPDSDGTFNSIMLHQGGASIPGKRIK